MSTLRLWWLLRHHELKGARLTSWLPVIAFGVTTASLLVAVSGLLAFDGRRTTGLSDAPGPSDPAALYTVLAALAVGLMAVPILTLGGLAARLSVSRRNQRLAQLRLAGATSGQVGVFTIAETTLQAGVGAIGGIAAYLALVAALARIPFLGGHLGVDELWVGPVVVVAVAAAVVLLAATSGLVSLAAVAVTPLGVASRVSPARLSLLRVAATGLMLLVWVAVPGGMGQVGIGVLCAVLVATVASINLVGPWAMMLFGHVVARLARRPAMLLAARRIVDDPRSAWRTTSTMGLGVLLATLATVTDGITTSPDDDLPYLGQDMATGALITLAIVSVIAATAAGVVQAARVLDQTPQYRALAYAGTDLATLHRARTLEVALPLAVTVALTLGFSLLLFASAASFIGAGMLARFAAAVTLSVGLLVVGLLASRGLLRDAVRLG
ncbi:FtsX-like permease family protein [Actinomycetota bacterium]